MAKYPQDLKYTNDHEWTKIEGNAAVIGITFHAQDALGEVVFVELPAVGTVLKKGDTFGVVESIKAVSDLYSPVSGKILEVNNHLVDNPSLTNTDSYGEAWMVKIEMSDTSEANDLLSPEEYTKLVDSL